jgi:hypothetical protein
MLQRIGILLERAIVFLMVASMLWGEYLPPNGLDTLVGRAAGDQVFDFGQWEGEALLEKAAQITVPVQDYLTDDQRRQYVLDFMQQLRSWYQLDGQVRSIYADASIKDPAAASADLRSKRDALRADLEGRRPTVEAIIQQQIASVLIDEGFAVGGEIVPPIAARITPLPNILIVSPRDQIKREAAVGLQASLTVDQAEQIESTVMSTTDQSALVVPIGGLAAYPTMILESTDLLWLLQTTAHEWTHNWLDFRPLGYSYLTDAQDVRTINETVASLTGDEVGLEVMRRYYLDELKRTHPDLVEPRPLTIPTPEPASPPPGSTDPNRFDFNRTMRDTRIQVDALLAEARDFEAQARQAEANTQADQAETLRAQAEGKIVAAETYMEQQRVLINSHGYALRKINQAYFAFYGAYADQPGAAGSDPIGPNVIALRVYSPSLRAFLDRVSSVLTLDELKQAVEEARPK